MKFHGFAAALTLVFLGGFTLADADDLDHFHKVKVPADEARILALAGVREMRCNYEIVPAGAPLPAQGATRHYQQDLLLFAEEYQGATCTARYRLALAVDGFTDPKAPRKGILSLGWNEEKHELVSVVENGDDERYSPWTKSAVLTDFSYMDHLFFENSHPEQRHSNTGTSDFTIYPVIGLCGNRTHQIQEFGFTDAASYLLACTRAQASNAVVVYLYKSTYGEEPPLHFDK